jgi:LacI family transcriptional regulator
MNLKELAGLLNLSTTTVSRALNGYPEVNEVTRDRVAAAAARHGYAPNQVAKRLATGRSHAIGHVIPLAEHQMINPIFAEFISGAGEAYSIAGYDLIASVVPEAEEAAAYRAMVAQRKVDGILVHTPRLIDPRIDQLSALGLPFLMHGRDSRPEQDYCWIDINNRRAFLRATDLLLDLGHRRIGFLNGMEHLNFAQRRRSGYLAALAARGVAADPALMRSSEMTENFGHASVIEMMALPDPPTAFLASSIISAFGALRAINELGLRLGADVSIVTHDDDLSHMPNAGAVPLFTATRSPIRAAGRRAAEMLLALIESPATAARSEFWEVDLTIGRSTGPRQ